ncbi:MAG: response regulator transcription factor [Coriobacteriia bacterium]|nr:response regulator transcription factor [Coriobacteriia bacterium]
MDASTGIDKRTVVICAGIAFVFYSTANILQTPIQIGGTTSQSTVLSLFKAGFALLLALYMLKVGISFRRLLMIWGVAVFFFVSSPVLGLLSESAFTDHVYFVALGIATSTGLIVVTTLLSRLSWNTIKYVVIIQHMLAGSANYALTMLGFTDIKAAEYFFYVLFVIATVVWIVSMGAERDFELVAVRPAVDDISQLSRTQITLTAMAIGGAALAPFLFGAFEQLAPDMLELAYLQPTSSLIDNLGIPAIILIGFLFKKEISIEVSFFMVSIGSFVFLLIALLDSRFTHMLYFATLALVIYMHLAIWLFVFKVGKSGPVQAGVLMGISVFTVSFTRMCGNLTAYVARALTDAQSTIDTVNLWALAVFALINLSLFVITYRLQRKIADSASAENQASVKTSLETCAQELATRFSLSQREYQVLLEYAAGRSAPFIAKKYYLSVFTVKNYVGRFYAKMGIHDRQQLLDLLEAEERRK